MMSHTPSAILAVSSLDRYTTGIPNSVARLDRALLKLFDNTGQPGNDFELVSPSAFIYGYITRIAISQVQIEYRIPTVVPSNRVFRFANNPEEPVRIGNDVIPMLVDNSGATPSGFDIIEINIPYGFYTPEELAAMLQIQITSVSPRLSGMKVSYSNSGGGKLPGLPIQPGDTGYGNSFIFSTMDVSGAPIKFGFPNILILGSSFFYNYNDSQISAVLKLYRLLGITGNNTYTSLTNYLQTSSPNFLFTPYIDIVSNNLTKFQKVKDVDTSVNGRNGLISRVYLAGVGFPVATSAAYSLGSEPFSLTADLNTPKLIRWNKDETVYNMDFKLYDQYGDLIYWTNNNPTEFQMTLLCMEEDD